MPSERCIALFWRAPSKLPVCVSCFFPPVWPIRTRHGPYNSVSGEKHLEKDSCGPKPRANHHINTNKQTKKRNQQRSANPQPDLRFAKKQNSEATKNGAGPKQKPTNQLEICLGHSDLSHCLITKNTQTNKCGRAKTIVHDHPDSHRP